MGGTLGILAKPGHSLRALVRFLSSAIMLLMGLLVPFSLTTYGLHPRDAELATDLTSLHAKAVQEKANGHFDSSIKLFKAFMLASTDEDRSKLDCLLNLALLHWNIGDLEQSRLYFSNAAVLSSKLKAGEIHRIAQAAAHIHNLYKEGKDSRVAEEYQKSIQSFENAIALSREIEVPEFELKCTRMLSLTFWELNDFDRFCELNRVALKLAEILNHNRERARCLINIAAYYGKYDNYSSALMTYERALKIAREENDLGDVAVCLLNIGGIWSDLGNYERSLDNIKEALNIDTLLADETSVAKDLNNLGIATRLKGISLDKSEVLKEARDIFLKALEIAKKVEDRTLETQVLNNIGSVCADLREYDRALGYFTQAASIAERANDNSYLGMVYNNIGITHANLGKIPEAAKYYNRALGLSSSYKDGTFVWETYLELGNARKNQADYPRALEAYKSAIASIEDIRSRIELEELKASYLGTDKRIEAYQNLIGLLVTLHKTEPNKGYDADAFNYLERAKARAFLDNLEVADIDVTHGINPVLASREKELMREISRAYSKLIAGGLPDEEKRKVSETLKTAEDQLEALKREIRLSSPAYADLKYPEIITCDEVWKDLPMSEGAYFAYCVGKDSSHAFVISRGGLKIFNLPPKAVLQRQVVDYRKAISDRQNRDFHLGRELFQELISPGIEPGLKKIVVIPDDVLNLLPFETLLTSDEPRSWMIKEYMVGYVPSLSSLRILKKRQLNKPKPSFDLLAVGNISYGSNGEVADQASGALFELGFPQVINLPALKYSALEIQNISRFFKKSRVTVLSQDKASERKLRSLTLSDFKIIHFATHSLIDDKRPARSAVVLSRIENQSEDGLLQAREIFNLNLNADLVTLSACQSGLGQFIRGEGIEGLSRAFFYAGSSSVLMSLWAVNDQATCQLMERFYRHLRRSESLMDALRSAKREMIDTGAVSHPYYWAGFIVNGKVDTQVFSGNRYASALLIGTLGVAVVFLLGIAFRRHNKA